MREELIEKAFNQFAKEIEERRFYILGEVEPTLKEKVDKMNFGGYISNPSLVPLGTHILIVEGKSLHLTEDYNYHLVFRVLKREEIPKIRYSRIYLGQDSE